MKYKMQKTITLARSKEDDFAYSEKLAQYQGEFDGDLFSEEGIEFLRGKGLLISKTNLGVLDYKRIVYVLHNDFKYEGTKHHFTLIGNDFRDVLLLADELVDTYELKSYIILKKNTGSINTPHWHLLVY